MKPAPFALHVAESTQHAVNLLADHADDDPKLLAGGQSLVAMMSLRLARPGVIVDIGRLDGLRGMAVDNDGLRIGAMTRHADVEHVSRDLGELEVVRTATRHIGHVPIRLRGTVGGSIAHADPAAEWCLLVTLLDAQVVVQGPNGRRTVAPGDLFDSFLTTTLADDELLVQVRFSWRPAHTGFEEFTRRHGDFAVVAAGVAHDRAADGAVTRPRVALGGVAPTVVRVAEAEEAMAAADPADPAAADVVADAAAEAIDPSSDPTVSADARRRIANTMVARALRAAGWASR